MTTGAINVVRGARSSDQELFQIYEHSERFVNNALKKNKKNLILSVIIIQLKTS